MTQPAGQLSELRRQDVFRGSSSVQTVWRILQRASSSAGCGPEKSRPGRRSPPDSSPIQINTEGSTPTNRSLWWPILYEYDQGGWNEWHVMMNDGRAMALHAQSEYALSCLRGAEPSAVPRSTLASIQLE